MTVAILRKGNNESIASILQEVEKSLQPAPGEVVIDFSSVSRLDGSAVRSLADFVSKAEANSVKIILRGVNVDVYKVLVLIKLASRLSFVN